MTGQSEIFSATYSGDLDRMLRAADRKASRLERHFLLLNIVMLTYKRRDDPRMRMLCRMFSEVHLREFDELAPALKADFGFLPRVPTFQFYAAILTEDGQFQKAIDVCRRAIAFGLHDGTQSGFEGRIARIQKRMKPRAAPMPSKPKPRNSDPDLQQRIDALVADGWVYAEGKDDDTGAGAMVLYKGEDRIRLTMGVTTEGGMLRAFIGFDSGGLTHERRDRQGVWRRVGPDGFME
ncbi:MAG: hypothetical protein AB1752_12475 [Candidatus Zixiibacteriota bacterium]